MPQPLQHRRGTTLPASLAEGEFFFKTDTEVWYSGPAGGGVPVIVNAVPPSFSDLGELVIGFGAAFNTIEFVPLSGSTITGTLTEDTTGVYDISSNLTGLPACGGVVAGIGGTPALLVSVNPDEVDKVYVFNTSGVATDPSGIEGKISFFIKR